MSSLAKITQAIPDIFGRLIDRFGFVIELEDEYRLFLRSPGCIIDIIFERYGYGFSVSLIIPTNVQYRYNYLLLMTMRYPGYRESMRTYDGSLPEEKNLILDLSQLCDNLLRFCPDLLAGVTTILRQEGYHEFASYIEDRIPIVVNMPLDDPISKKFWKGDFTWAKDLQEREQQDGSATTSP